MVYVRILDFHSNWCQCENITSTTIIIKSWFRVYVPIKSVMHETNWTTVYVLGNPLERIGNTNGYSNMMPKWKS